MLFQLSRVKQWWATLRSLRSLRWQ